MNIPIIGPLISAISDQLTMWQKRRLAKEERKFRIEEIRAEGEVERAKSLAQAEANYDNIAQQQMATSWKDEYLVIVLSAPFVVSFVAPFLDAFLAYQKVTVRIQPLIDQAWVSVAKAPSWYQYAFWGVIIATFGLRWAVKHIKGRALGVNNGRVEK